jgi:hypothetical protein
MADHATPTPRPATDVSPKVTAAAAAAALVTIAVWALEASTGIDVPTLVEGAAVVLITFGAGWAIPDRS